nr:immunoglobulin heavy chain junction region [Macaca mulatta]MOX63216.1 immunoglobulin heavy chain junction region [Macaca mulatta]MOX65197.1 immunoglobulin heavy chain junction region [Macaca mulatta]MOX65621.1 immunoglobulin heavy chain junction region [Macaca mulatta]MOX67230.1 immunoglobulin heavy chain junction region [Macaca mulatta]
CAGRTWSGGTPLLDYW